MAGSERTAKTGEGKWDDRDKGKLNMKGVQGIMVNLDLMALGCMLGMLADPKIKRTITNKSGTPMSKYFMPAFIGDSLLATVVCLS